MPTASLIEFMEPWTPLPPSTSPSWTSVHLTNRIRWEGFQMAACLLFISLLQVGYHASR